MKKIFIAILLVLQFSSCTEEKKIVKEDKFILSEVDSDTLTADELSKFIKVEIDSFNNDTTFILDVKIDEKIYKNKSQFLIIDFRYNPGVMSQTVFVNFVTNRNYPLRESSGSNISFKVDDNVIVNPFTDGINSNSIMWAILNLSDIDDLKKLSAGGKILVRLAEDSESDMLLTKEQRNGFAIFTKFIENKGYFKRIINRM